MTVIITNRQIKNKEGEIFKGKEKRLRIKLWYRGKDVLINKVSDLAHKENFMKIKEAITSIVDTGKLCT